MKTIRYILIALSAALVAASCSRVETPAVVNPDKQAISPIISASCLMDNVNSNMPYLATRSIIDQITTQSMEANFIRINEDVKGGTNPADMNDGCYTFTGGYVSPYTTVNWERASMLEASVISSPDNTPDIHYRSISFIPVQSYNIIAVAIDPNNPAAGDDTTHFYHTRMVGWYPKSCVLPRNEKGNAVYTLFDDERFDGVRNDEVVIPNHGVRVGIKFSGLDGSKDVMVSNVKEAQHLHAYNSSDPHSSDVHPIDGSKIYRSPFGHYTSGPVYSNYFTYKHYLSAVRVWAYAEQSDQNLDMWGNINNVVFQDQPQSCKIWLPEELDTEYGEVYEWGETGNNSIITTPMYGDDGNHSSESYSATFPISLRGAGSKMTKIYLGYSLVKPNSDLELELHTTNGVYVVDVASVIDSTGASIFEAGYVYDVMLNLKTTGTIAVLLENESADHYYDLTTLSELQVGEEKTINAYKYANCYIVSPNDVRYQRLVDTAAGTYVPYEGFCFAATTVGNGSDGIKSYGSQQMYPSSAAINPSYAQLIWETSLGLVSEVELLYGYVRFKVPNSSKKGNAVLGVFDSSNNLLWSWHIWITDYPEDQSFMSGTAVYTLLDRNLGATRSVWNNGSSADEVLETYGLYYQWGRKDPSMGPASYDYAQINLMCAPYWDYSSAKHTSAEVKQLLQPTMKDGVENPMYLILPAQKTQDYSFNWLYTNNNILWGTITSGDNPPVTTVSKTIYDPCPFGYRVPASELSTLIENTDVSSTGTYGQIRTDGTTDFYFPYAGFKGVDKGLNSIVGEWKYVGQKGDYQSAIYSETSGSTYLHRSRLYLSKSNSWEETGVGTYSGNTNQDYTNRRTAASVRCVKINDYGIVTSSLGMSSFMVCGSTLNITMNAQSSGSEISYIKLERIYKYVGSDTDYSEVVYEARPSNTTSFNEVYAYAVPDVSEFVSTGKYQDAFEFKLTVTNNLGVSHSSTATARRLSFSSDFSYSVASPLVGVEQPVVGQPATLTVTLRCSSEFDRVTINGQNPTSGSLPQLVNGMWEGTYTLEDATFDTAGNINVPITASIVGAGGGTISTSGVLPVWGITTKTVMTSVNFVANTYYVFSNTNYSGTFVSVNDNNNGFECGPINYSSIFFTTTSISSNGSRTYLKNLKSNKYIGYSGLMTYSLTFSDTQSQRFYYRYSSGITLRTGNNSGAYWRQTSSTVFNLSSTNSNNKWNVYTIDYVAP